MAFFLHIKTDTMKHITHESILNAIALIDNLDENQFVEQLSLKEEKQPVLLGYLMSAAEEYENEMLEGLIMYYFSLIIEAFKNEGVEIGEVTEEHIDAFQEPFHEMLDEYFDTDNEEILDDFCDQPHFTRFMIVEVSEPDEDGTELDDETATQLFIVALAAIVLLTRTINN
jgi:hypothetical protein